MQIIGGTARGTKLATPLGKTTRPTAQRSREAMFNLLMGGRFTPSLHQAHIIDVFAGSGAIGLEALSRGAAHASFIEMDKSACQIIQQNIKKMRVQSQSSVISNQVAHIQHWSSPPASILFCDAPYADALSVPALTHLTAIGALQPKGLIIAETHKKELLNLPDRFELKDRRIYGIAAISIFNWQS